MRGIRIGRSPPTPLFHQFLRAHQAQDRDEQHAADDIEQQRVSEPAQPLQVRGLGAGQNRTEDEPESSIE